MGNLLKTELYKLKNDRSFRTLLFILILFSLLYPFTTNIDSASKLSLDEYYTYNILSINNDIIKLLPCIFAGFFITSEYSNGTMKSIVSSGNSRLRIYFSKLTMFSIGSAIILLILPIFMSTTAALHFDFNGPTDWMFIFKTYGLITIYGAAFASVMTIIATIFTDNGKTIGFLLMFFALINSLLSFIGSKLTFLQTIIKNSVFMQFPKIYKVNQLDHSEVFTLILVPILTFIVLGILGSFIFRKKEIK
ncbi:ABC transporter permease [Gottfriedia acidiceleris]|uniref:ABC transporter permease n=1 Tax=Gottfriedia acidiceleris TaxID=371036 RepID=UPI00101CBA81|nr:ABC transporter permease [Gottfriedia acidiceleris]